MFLVMKASAPAPQLYFQPSKVALTRDQMVEVRLNPKPQTLNSKPKPLNPNPQTLNLQP